MEKVRIQDDLYQYVNGEWIEKAVIPNDRPTTGGFADLDKGVEELLREDFKKMIEEDKYPNDYLKRACKLYQIAMDTKRRSQEGIRPVLKDLKRIKNLNDCSSLNRHLKDFVIDGMPLPIDISVEPDMKDTTRSIIYLAGPSTILPDTTYYKEEIKAQRDAMLGMWANMASAVLASTRLSKEEQEQYVKDTLAFDAIIATMVKSSEERSEYTKMYNMVSLRTVSSYVKPLKIRKLLADLLDEVPEKVSLADPRFFKEFAKLFNEDNFELYKHWAYVNKLLNSCGYLSEKLRDLGGSFGRALTGVAQMSSVERFSYKLASGVYAGPVGLYYGEKYFGEEAKKDVIDMVKEIIETYKERVKNNNFLAAATKEKAIKKLSTMNIKMGYPDEIEEIYTKLIFNEEDSLYDVMMAIHRIRILDSINKLTKKTNPKEWGMPGHMVNACYNPFVNDITFPAAILQAPFYSIKQTRSQNLGGIGAVIGHEISHAFDNNGAKFDEKGNLFDWWTKEDLKQFNLKTKAMIKEFDGITLPWGKVNSSLIVSENIADNGGMAVTLNIMSKMKNANYEAYFTNWAKVWCVKAKPEYQQILLNIDVHAPAVLRANMPPRNFSEWYKTFNVTKKDKMYIAENKRVVIW